MRTLRASVFFCAVLLAQNAAAQDAKTGGGEASSAPAAAAAAPAAAPNDWTFDFHGYFRAPLRLGFGHNDNPYPGQATTTIHTPVVPDDQYYGWAYTSLQERDYAEAFFSYGNNWVRGTLGVIGFNFTDASYVQNSAQFGVGQGWLTLTPSLGYKNLRFEAKVGSFWSKYGTAGKYDTGKYDTYLFGRTHLMGETLRLELDLGKTTLWAEQGFGGKQPDPNVYNNAKFSLAAHVHGGVRWNRMVDVGVHFLDAWTAAEDPENTGVPARTFKGLADGKLTVAGADLAIRNTILGELYFGFSRIGATNVGTVTNAIEVLHSNGGGEFSMGVKSNFLDRPQDPVGNAQQPQSHGNGSVKTILFQYEFSVANLLAKLKGKEWWGDGPNFVAAVFGMVNWIKSDDAFTNDTHKVKYGGDFLVTPVKWFGIGTRIDRVQPTSAIPEESFRVISPRLVFKTAWVTHEEVTFQYSRYTYSQRDCVTPTSLECAQPPSSPYLPNGFGATQYGPTGGTPGSATQKAGNDANTRGSATSRPDVNVIKLQATMWW